jgi:predicted nuclease with TOPRIM domain
MTAEPASDLIGWVRQGERIFGQVLQSLRRCSEIEAAAQRLAQENQRLQEEIEATREELHQLRAERLEAAESLKTIAEHVTQLATAALQRLSRRVL